jgi:hypothetical protein
VEHVPGLPAPWCGWRWASTRAKGSSVTDWDDVRQIPVGELTRSCSSSNSSARTEAWEDSSEENVNDSCHFMAEGYLILFAPWCFYHFKDGIGLLIA